MLPRVCSKSLEDGEYNRDSCSSVVERGWKVCKVIDSTPRYTTLVKHLTRSAAIVPILVMHPRHTQAGEEPVVSWHTKSWPSYRWMVLGRQYNMMDDLQSLAVKAVKPSQNPDDLSGIGLNWVVYIQLSAIIRKIFILIQFSLCWVACALNNVNFIFPRPEESNW